MYGNPVVCLGRVYRGVPRLEDTRLCGRSGCRILRGYRLARRCGNPILYRILTLLTGCGGILPVILHNLPVVQVDCAGALRRNLRIVGDDHEGFTLLRNECEQKIHDLLGGHAVERAGGFIRKGNRCTGNL